jgi:hypothetical protein
MKRETIVTHGASPFTEEVYYRKGGGELLVFTFLMLWLVCEHWMWCRRIVINPSYSSSSFSFRPGHVLSSALSKLQYSATRPWNGLVRVVVQIFDRNNEDSSALSLSGANGRDSVSAFSLQVDAVNDTPVLYWRNDMLLSALALLVLHSSQPPARPLHRW